MASRWKRIGVMLKVSTDVLEIIGSKHGHEPMDALLEVFTAWQKTRSSPYNWKTILDVLTSSVVARNDVAEDVRRCISDGN